MSDNTNRTGVFISYSHADEKWRSFVEKHLSPLGRDHQIRVWSDKNIKPGEPWLARIQRELATAKVGIMLVSHNFMASEFIHSDELPPLLLAAKKEGVTLLTVVVGYCHFANSPLSKLQTFNKPDKPLEALTTPQRNKEMARLCALLMKIFGLKAGSAKPKAANAVSAQKAVSKVPKRISVVPKATAAEVTAKKKTSTSSPKPSTKVSVPRTPVAKAASKPAAKRATKPATKAAPKASVKKAGPRAKK